MSGFSSGGGSSSSSAAVSSKVVSTAAVASAPAPAPRLRLPLKLPPWSLSRLLVPALALLLLVLHPHPASSQEVSMSRAIELGDILEMETECYEPLYQSDADGDGRVDRTEYITFVNRLTDPPGYFDYAGADFKKLPLALRANFINLACICEAVGGDNRCCTGDSAHISTSGAGPNDDPSPAEAIYLFKVCTDTYTTVEAVVTEAPTFSPTGVPTAAPADSPTTLPPTQTPTSDPTNQPTSVPTYVPTTSPPTPNPTDAPTRMPVAFPTTAVPTPSPTLVPTTSPPTVPPTTAPVAAPTTSIPTVAPTFLPTPAPTTSPTSPPTSIPTKAPTNVITGPLPVSFDLTLSNLEGLTAADLEMGRDNVILDDVAGGLALLIPEILAEMEAAKAGGSGGANAGAGTRTVGDETEIGGGEGSDDGSGGDRRAVLLRGRVLLGVAADAGWGEDADEDDVRSARLGVGNGMGTVGGGGGGGDGIGGTVAEEGRRRYGAGRDLAVSYDPTVPPVIDDVVDTGETQTRALHIWRLGREEVVAKVVAFQPRFW